MINIGEGNLLHADVEALVNTVNTEGIMGKGIALQFKNAYPAMYEAYAQRAKSGRVELGKMDVFDLGGLAEGPHWIINFPTKGHWKAKSKIVDIANGLQNLVSIIKRLKIQSIAIPPLGCGNGGLNWSDVRPLIESAFRDLPEVRVVLFEPKGAPLASEMPNRTPHPKMTPGQATVLALMGRYLAAQLDPFVSLLEVHKLMYFMQESGEPLKLKYISHHYGPYAVNLRQLLSRMEGHYLLGFGEGSDDPEKVLEVIDDAGVKAEQFLRPNTDALDRMERVAKLIEGFEDSYGLELLSSVHWVMRNNPRARLSADDAIAEVKKWNLRKSRRMKPEHMRKAWRRLKDLRWDSEARSISH